MAALNQNRGMMICGHPKLPEKFLAESLGFFFRLFSGFGRSLESEVLGPKPWKFKESLESLVDCNFVNNRMMEDLDNSKI